MIGTMSRRKKIVIVLMLGIIAGIALVPKAIIHETLWSSVEAQAARAGINLHCTEPQFGFRSLNTGPCTMKYGVLGVEIKSFTAALAGITPFTVAADAEIFGDSCSISATGSSISITRCKAFVNTVPQLLGFGFTAGELMVSGTVNKPQKGAQIGNANIGFLIENLNHPALTTTKLGFGAKARVLLIPAFSAAKMNGTFISTGDTWKIVVPELSASVMQASNIEVTGGAESNSELSGTAKFSLLGDGIRQYGPLIDALVGKSETAQAEDLGAGESAKFYQLIISGNNARPQFRVLKISNTR